MNFLCKFKGPRDGIIDLWPKCGWNPSFLTHLTEKSTIHKCSWTLNNGWKRTFSPKTTAHVVQNLKQAKHAQKVSMKRLFRARIFKRLRHPGIDSKELIPPGCESIPGPLLQVRAQLAFQSTVSKDSLYCSKAKKWLFSSMVSVHTIS